VLLPCFYRYCINVDGSPQPTVQAPTGGNTTLMLTETNAIKRPWLDHAGKTSGRLSGYFEIVASSTFNGGRSVRPAIPRFMIAPLATYCPEDSPRSVLGCFSRRPSEKAPNPMD
jgi:hypothetical protein